ncbi:MAG: hypothetical protein ABJE66_09465 [Deltaproteobacteria bacterium]
MAFKHIVLAFLISGRAASAQATFHGDNARTGVFRSAAPAYALR